jgi:hypothetical protein
VNRDGVAGAETVAQWLEIGVQDLLVVEVWLTPGEVTERVARAAPAELGRVELEFVNQSNAG